MALQMEVTLLLLVLSFGDRQRRWELKKEAAVESVRELGLHNLSLDAQAIRLPQSAQWRSHSALG